MLSLDEITGAHRLDLVKLYFKGKGLFALKGMNEILRRKAPSLVIEFCSDWFGKNEMPPIELLSLLESYGYRIKVIDDQRKVEPFDLHEEMRTSMEAQEFNYNLLCVPNV